MSLITATPKWDFTYDTVGPSPPTDISANSGERSLNPRFTPPTGETNIIKYHFYCTPSVRKSTGTGGTGSGGNAGTDATSGTAGTDAATAGTDTGGTAGTDTGGTAGTDTGGTDTGGTATTAGTDTGGIAGTDTGGTAGTAGTTTDTGSAGETGAGGESSSAVSDDPLCASLNDQLVPGEPPPADLAECGSVTATGASEGSTNDTLENGVSYAIAVAAEDDANNIGNLSKLACGVPKEVTGFYEAYTAAGGQAGGGFCTFAPARRGSLAMAALMLLGTCALIARRRR
jgi:hypothetical protein